MQRNYYEMRLNRMQNPMTPNSSISRTVMRRVRAMHTIRTYAPIAGAGILFIVALGGIGREVWVAKVFENMPSYADLPGVLSFFSGAFLHTELVVQVLLILALGALVWLARSLALIIGASMNVRRA